MGSILDSCVLGSGVDIKMKPWWLTELELFNWGIEVGEKPALTKSWEGEVVAKSEQLFSITPKDSLWLGE